MVITRFAPSPTGDPHIGNIRSALFAYLFAKSQGGKFLLRIEDTDQKRLDEKSVDVIKEALRWLEIVPENIDEPMVQSTRLKIYQKAAFELIEKDAAYICTCSKERLEDLRREQTAKGQPLGYDGCCRKKKFHLPADKPADLPENAVIRMKLPENEIIEFEDLVRGKISVSTKDLDDSILLKSDGFPTYHLAAIIDDHEMDITHVIRAEEWLPSTPKHIFLHRAFGWEPPKFAHLPVILGPNKGKLSKRDGATGILEYRKLGYLPDALINFMVLLGWNPKTEEEFFTLSDLEKKFDISQVNKAAAVFDINKLNHFNSYYLQKKSPGELKKALADFETADLKNAEAELLGRGGYSTLKEMSEYIVKLRQTPEYPKEMLVFKKSTPEATQKGLKAALETLQKVGDADWNLESLQKALADAVSEQNLSNGDVFWPVRVALSGAEKSPSPVELLLALGKEESIKRIESVSNL
jgi:glutamyl-tRNA synthetase